MRKHRKLPGRTKGGAGHRRNNRYRTDRAPRVLPPPGPWELPDRPRVRQELPEITDDGRPVSEA